MDTVVARWNAGRRFVAVDSAGHSFVMDAKPEHHGEGSGMRPLEVVLAGLAGCTGIDVIGILEKQRQPVEGLEVIVRAEQREEQPRIYVRIEVEYVVKGAVAPKQLERAISLSEEKYCSVKGMLVPEIEMSSSYRIVDDD